MRYRWSPLFVILIAVLARPAAAQQQSVQWHHDLESAKVVAKQTKRLVLVHFWTTSCGPCLALDQNVFNQPGVSAAIEAQFVPVNRVPTDIVITPDGKLVGKLISPPTPSAYVAEVTGIANKHATMSGQAYAAAAAQAPVQPQINAAYAGLKVGSMGPPSVPVAYPTNALPQQLQQPILPATPGATAAAPPIFNPSSNGYSSASVGTQPVAGVPASPSFAPNSAQSVAPQTVPNQAAAMPFAGSQPMAQPPITPIGTPPVPAVSAPVGNPYFGAPAAAVPPAQPAAPPVAAITPGVQYGTQAPLGATGISPTAAAPSAMATPTGAPDQRQLPPGSPPLGFDGYCPVSMRNSWKWVPGNPQWGIVHRGRTYWFASAEEQKQFWTDPDRYTPALSGMDPVLAIDHQQQIPGKREHSLDYDGLFYMFASEATLQQFTANPQRYAAGVRQAMGILRGRLVR
jgi:YHS domain-containing protein/thiol-disulfide isomerase/thioredoxin